jgi:uncharacterized SAM-binding protein YcdF (DUF218 family)
MLRTLVRTASFALLLYVLGYALFVVMIPRPADDSRTDAVIVLTGGAGRIERGLDTLQRGLARRMLISGVQRTVRPQELAAEHEVEQRLFDCCIDLGREAVDTRTNADEVARWVERRRVRSLRLVTTDWHMPRAKFEISKRLSGDVSVLTDAVQSNPSLRQLFTEYNKFLLGHVANFIGI